MHPVNLGNLLVGEQLLVIDPQNNPRAHQPKGVLLHMQPGLYQVELGYGRLRKPITDEDKDPHTFYNRQLQILLPGVSRQQLLTTTKAITARSKIAGFFTPATYRQEFAEPRLLKNEMLRNLKNRITQNEKHLANEQLLLQQGKRNEYFNYLLKQCTNEDQLRAEIATVIKELELEINQDSQHLFHQTCPPHYKPEYSKKFFNYIRDLIRTDYLGAVCPLGRGAAAYAWGLKASVPLLLAKNEAGLVVGAALEFLSPEEAIAID